jgi:hypothetical protein
MLMSLRDVRRARRLCSAAAALALLGTAAPLHAHARVDLTNSPTQSTVCQVSITIQMTSVAVGVTVPPSLGTTGATYTMTGSGTCSGLAPGPFQLSGGAGSTQAPPTCADFVSTDGGAIVVVGQASFTVAFYLAGTTAEGQMLMTASGIGGAGTAVLTMTTASLLACSQPGGTTTLQYTGVAVFAVT